MNKGKFVLGTVLGAAAGVVAGMLTAPKSGEETRADLKARAAELKEEAARRAASMNSDSKNVIDTLKDKVESVTEIGKKPTDEVKKTPSDKK